MRIFMSLTVELIWLPRYVKLSIAFISTSDNVLIEPCWFKFICLVLSVVLNIKSKIFGNIFLIVKNR